MNRTISIITGVLILLSITACSEEPPKVTTAPLAPQATKPAPEPPKPVAGSDINAEWPFIQAGSDAEVTLSDNYLTRNYVLVFDGSGSMAESGCSAGRYKIDVAKEAVMEWAKALPPDANLGLVAFYYNRWAIMDLEPVDINRFSDHIRTVKAGGKTPLTDAMKHSYTMLTKAGKKQLGYGNYTIVVVTDGIANDSNALSGYVSKILTESPVNIHTIGFCIGMNHALNQPGQTIYKAADNPDDLKKGLSDVLAESETFDEGGFN